MTSLLYQRIRCNKDKKIDTHSGFHSVYCAFHNSAINFLCHSAPPLIQTLSAASSEGNKHWSCSNFLNLLIPTILLLHSHLCCNAIFKGKLFMDNFSSNVLVVKKGKIKKNNLDDLVRERGWSNSVFHLLVLIFFSFRRRLRVPVSLISNYNLYTFFSVIIHWEIS